MILDLKSRNMIKELMKKDKATATQGNLANRMVEVAREENDNSFTYTRTAVKKLLNPNEKGYIGELAFHYLAKALDTTQDYILFKDEYMNEDHRKRCLGYTKEEINEDLTAWKDSIRKKNQTIDVVKKVLDALELDPEVLGVHREKEYRHKRVHLTGKDLDTNKLVSYTTSYEEAKKIVEEQEEDPASLAYSEIVRKENQFESKAIKISIQPNPEESEKEYCIPIENIADLYNDILDVIQKVIAKHGTAIDFPKYDNFLDGLEKENKPLPEHWQNIIQKVNESKSK